MPEPGIGLGAGVFLVDREVTEAAPAHFDAAMSELERELEFGEDILLVLEIVVVEVGCIYKSLKLDKGGRV